LSHIKTKFICPDIGLDWIDMDWIDMGHLGCYLLYTKQTASYEHAQRFCQHLHSSAHLVEIYNEDIQRFVESINVSSHHRFWIGATDRQNVSFKS